MAFWCTVIALIGGDQSWRSRWERLTQEQRERFAPICPDVVLELMSRTDRGNRARERITSFRKNGAVWAVLIDPYKRAIEVNGETKPWEPIEFVFPGCETPFVLDPCELD